MKNTLIVILLAAVIVLGYLQFKPKVAPLVSPVSSVVPTGQTTTINNPNGTDYQPPAPTAETAPASSAASVETTVLKKEWGIAFNKKANWTIISNTGTQMVLRSGGDDGNPATEGDGDTITIDYVTGNNITSTDAKFGSITYFYDNAKGWMETDDQEGEGISPHPTPVEAVSLFPTAGALPVFHGTGRWATYIVPLSHTTFLKLNIGGGGLTQPLTDLVKTIIKTQPSGR